MYALAGEQSADQWITIIEAGRLPIRLERLLLVTVTTVLSAAISPVQARTDLTAFADANGYIDVQVLACAALAGTWLGDADRLTTLVQRQV